MHPSAEPDRSAAVARLVDVEPPMNASAVAAPGRVHATLVLVRHGESVWNRSLRFTGWVDVPLSRRGREQAERAGVDLRARGLGIDVCHCSRLRRATETRDILLAALGAAPPCHDNWRLNERHYGGLQGLNFLQAVWRFGLTPVMRCRRDLDAPPPRLTAPALAELAPEAMAPCEADEWRAAQRGESIAETLDRFLPVWTAEIEPALRSGSRVLVVAHNNLLRGLLRHLEGGTGRAPAARFATARPWLVELDRELNIVRREAV